MSPAVSRAADFSLEGYAGTPGVTAQVLAPYRRSHFERPPSPPAGVRSMTPASGYPRPSSRQAMQDDAERLQTPTTPCSDFSEGPGAAHCGEAGPESLSPLANDDKIATSVPTSPNKSVETPYAQLIYQAFMSSPRRALKLQEIYQWFLENTDKGQPGQGKGWQNSIRHNLSMNGAFERRPIKGDANDGGEDCSSPSGGASKQATEWVLQDWAIRQGVQSTTRYRNSARRSQNKKLRGRSRADTSSRKPSRRRASSRSTVHAYSLPPLSRFDLRDYRSHGYYGQYAPQFDTPAEQLERLSLAPRVDDPRRAMYFTGVTEYEHTEYHPVPTLGGPMETSMPSSYSSAPVSYSSELFMPSVPGAPTVASEDDVNEVITPEASFSILEPAVILHGDNSSTNHGPTSDPYSGGSSAYYNSAAAVDSNAIPRYAMGDVAGVCDEDMLRSCGWDGHQPSHQ
ncbi:hypothetical protein CONLIGDRAFT_686105 [Coniochaeta ligniaria NRRL 30616]|uniref:Fork-head domain-containing protein n=1 Tax=Coniochaeta ligniaria NRRL 30616 TaxID=1408157 RepID=A0A1J7J8P0_9PEZI|nr:hypothetical protein CONLIGDRAFT_686105 [Coniochaeta ligniaria NRRL 30616]